MNDLSNEALSEYNNLNNNKFCLFHPFFPRLATYLVLGLFLLGLSVTLLILVVVHNPSFFLIFLLLSSLVFCFLAWNKCSLRGKVAIFDLLGSSPDSDLASASDGQLVKVTGLASCGAISLRSSYERAAGCIYVSTLLYERGEFKLMPTSLCSRWSLTYCERFSTDFYITDRKSGIRAMVKAGAGCKVVPLIVESKLVTTTGHGTTLSPPLRRWLQERNLSDTARLLRLEEGRYIQEGNIITVVGILHKHNDILMIVEPQRFFSTDCLWRKLILPMDVDGLILGVPSTCSTPEPSPG